MENILSILTWGVALYQAWSIGANDETTAPVISGRVLTVNQAVIISSIIGTLGAVFLGSNVQETMGTGLLNRALTEECVLVILLTSSLWLTFVSYFGLAVSTTHSTIGAIIGYGIITVGLGDINWATIITVIGSWLISMIIGFSVAYLGAKAILQLKAKSSKPEAFERTCVKLLILSTFALQFSRGGNDVGNASGVMYSLFNPMLSRFLCGLAMAFGLLVLGRIVLGNVGHRLVSLTPSVALVSQSVALPLILFCSLIGIPLSGTHVMIVSILGGGLALKVRIDVKLARNFGIAWILSFVVPAFIAALFVVIGSSTGILILN